MNKIETGIVDATDTAEAAVPKSTVTTAGDIIYATGSAAVSRLGIGTAHQSLYTNAGQTAPTWGAGPKSLLTGTGDLLYSSAANTLARLGIGSAGQVLTVSGGLPVWAGGTGISITKYYKVTEKDVNTTITKTDLLNGEITVAANAMSSTGAIHIHANGDLLQNTGSQTIELELKLGSQVIWDSAASESIAASATRRAWHFDAYIQALSSTASQRGGGLFTLSSSTAATTGSGNIGDTGGSSRMFLAPFLGQATTVDMTSGQTLTLSVTLSTSSSSLSMRLESATILVY